MAAQQFYEKIVMDAGAQMRETADGYLVASPRIARTGIQIYKGWEVGKPELEDVRVYRPADEVFHVDAIASLAFKPLTLEHPDSMVDAKNWREYTVGHLGGEVLRDGDFIRVPMIVMDRDAVDAVKDGKREVSVGYMAMLEWGDGVSPAGEKYDATQKTIRANHVAITGTARGGRKLRIGDKAPKERHMATRILMVDNISVEMEDKDAQIVERHIKALTETLADLNKELATLKTTSEAAIAVAKTETATAVTQGQTKDAEIVTLKKQLEDAKMTPQKLDKLIQDRGVTSLKARALIGDALITEGKSDADMRRQVVLAKLGDAAKDWNDDMVAASFNTLAAGIDTSKGGSSDNNLPNVAAAIALNKDNGNAVAKAYQDYNNDITNRWKTAGVPAGK